jgi:hypothetical protein
MARVVPCLGGRVGEHEQPAPAMGTGRGQHADRGPFSKIATGAMGRGPFSRIEEAVSSTRGEKERP